MVLYEVIPKSSSLKRESDLLPSTTISTVIVLHEIPPEKKKRCISATLNG